MGLSRYRVLFVLEHFHPRVGGVETLFGALTTGLAARGHSVTVLTSGTPGAPLQERWNGIQIIRIALPSSSARYLFTVRAIPKAVQLARDVDLVHTTTYNAAFAGWLAGRANRRPAVLTVHEVWAAQWTRLPAVGVAAGVGFRLFEWAIFRLPFNAYHCDSNFTRERLVKEMRIHRDRTVVVYPAIDYSLWSSNTSNEDTRSKLGLRPEDYLYVYFGRPGVSKGIEYLIDAVEIVRRRLPNSRLLLILARHPRRHYQRLINRIVAKGLDDHIIVLDPMSRDLLVSHVQCANCVVVPSLSEGFGLAAVEGAVAGARVVSTAGHSVEEVLPQACFVPPRDPTALAAAIVAASTATSAAKIEQSFTFDNQVDMTLASYDTLIAREYSHPGCGAD
jgi:glycosyltransferase involved in cell wall biosynthesis